MAVVPLHRPVSVTGDVGSGVVAAGNRRSNGFDNRCWWWGALNVSVAISFGFGGRPASVRPFGFDDRMASVRPFGFGGHLTLVRPFSFDDRPASV